MSPPRGWGSHPSVSEALSTQPAPGSGGGQQGTVLGAPSHAGMRGAGRGEALPQEDVGAHLSDPRAGGEAELLPSDVQAPRLIPG